MTKVDEPKELGHTGVAGEGDEEVGLAVLPHNGHGTLVLLYHVPGSTHEARRKDHAPSEVAGVVTHPRGIGETRIESGTKFAQMVALIGKLGLFNLDSTVDDVPLKQSAPTVVHADELEIGMGDCALPSSISDAIGEELPL